MFRKLNLRLIHQGFGVLKSAAAEQNQKNNNKKQWIHAHRMTHRCLVAMGSSPHCGRMPLQNTIPRDRRSYPVTSVCGRFGAPSGPIVAVAESSEGRPPVLPPDGS
jgi:hypothetical protein